MSKEWENEEKITMRTRIALSVLLLMFKVVAPYQYGHQLKEDLEVVERLLKESAL